MRIILTEGQYDRIFLNDFLSISGVVLNEEENKSSITILPGPNAGEIQQFLINKGFYKGIKDWDFSDITAEAFAKYYGSASLGWIKTVEELYDELNVMGYDVGEKTGKLFGPKMAQVISDLIKEKESKNTNGITLGNDSELLTKKERWTLLNYIKNIDNPSNAKKLNISPEVGEFCKPCYDEEDDEELLNIFFGPPTPVKSKSIYGTGPKFNSCIACHNPHVFTNDFSGVEGEKAKVIYKLALQSYDQDPKEVYGKVLNAPIELGKAIYNSLKCEGSEGIDYLTCVIDNLSIGASLIPYVGTVVSAFFDAINTVIYLGEAVVYGAQSQYNLLIGDTKGYNEKQKEALMKLGFAGLSALGIIPGVTEAKAIARIGEPVIKATEKITVEITQKGVQNMSKREINNLIKKETKNLTEDQVKQVGELLQTLGDPKKLKNLGYEDVVKFNKEVDEFLKKYKSIKVKGRNVKISRRSLAAYIGTKEGKTILAKSGNDLSKALKSQAFKESFKTFIVQLTLSGVMVGGMGYYEYTKKEELEKDAFDGKIYAIVKLAGYDWNNTKEVFGVSPKDSYNDNILLKKAWKAGWRPYDEKKDPQEGVMWLMKNPKFQTDTFKEKYRNADVTGAGEYKMNTDNLNSENLKKYKESINNAKKSSSIEINPDDADDNIGDSLQFYYNKEYIKQKSELEGDNDIEKLINFYNQQPKKE